MLPGLVNDRQSDARPTCKLLAERATTKRRSLFALNPAHVTHVGATSVWGFSFDILPTARLSNLLTSIAGAMLP